MTGYADTLIEGRIFRGLHEGFRRGTGHLGRPDRGLRQPGRGGALCRGRRPAGCKLDGRVAIPAFNDAHQHLLPLGISMTLVNLRPERIRTLDGLLAAIRDQAARTPKGKLGAGPRL